MQYMKKYVILILAAAVSAMSAAQAQNSQPLRFGDDKSFTIAHFTDMHLNASTPYRTAQAEYTFARLSRIVHGENPDLLVFTGDIVTGKPAAGMWDRLIDSLDVYKIPFCIVLGNHDAEQELTRAQIASRITASPYSLNGKNAAGELADMELPVLSASGKKTSLVLYCMDSHDYSTIDGVDGYGWFYPAQVAWIGECCKAKAAANGGRPVPSLAFFHIPLPEYAEAWRDRSNTHIGRCAEGECPGVLNTGMFAEMVSGGSVMGVFTGHDHDNDYVVAKFGVALAYGRYSGDDTVYNNLRHGVRMIKLNEKERGFRTWVSEDDGRIADSVVFDGKEIKKYRK